MNEILVLRLVHVLGGTFWVGSALFSGLFLVPALASAGPAAAQVMGGLRQRRLFTVLPVVAVLTILSGLRLMWLTSGGFAPAYFMSPGGGVFAISGGAAVAAFALTLLVSRPTSARAMALGASIDAADESSRAKLMAERERLRKRSAVSAQIGMYLLILGAAGMAVARYVS